METNWNQHFFKFIEQNLNKCLNWSGLSKNPNITWDFVEANPNKSWNWYLLSFNKFAKDKEQFELRVKHQRFVQEHLFEELEKAYMHPIRIQKLLDMGFNI